MRKKIFVMRCFLVGSAILLLAACGTQKNRTAVVEMPVPHVNCPEGGDCTFEVLRDTELELTYDALGDLNPKIVPGNKVTVRYHFKKDEVPGTADSSHSEYLFLEFDPAVEQLILRDDELQQVKMVYGRICFCRGAMGYFPVTEGNLFLFNKNRELQIRSVFHVKKVPQIIQEIDEKIRY